MGSFFTNYQIRSESQENVVSILTPLVKQRAYVSPPKNGWVTVYDEASDEQDERELNRLATAISQKLSTAVFAFLIHDSDVLVYFLYSHGQLIDEYNSDPDYFGNVGELDRARFRGKPVELLKYCVSSTNLDAVERVLNPENHPIMAEDIFDDLAPLLDLDEARVLLGFRYFEAGDHDIPDAKSFQMIGKDATLARRLPIRKRPEMTSALPLPSVVAGGKPVEMYPPAVVFAVVGREIRPEQEAIFAVLSNAQKKKLQSQMSQMFDLSVKQALEESKIPNQPTAEELIWAADKGLEAVAELVANKTPQWLDAVAVLAAAQCSPAFLRALIERGAKLTATDQTGRPMLVCAIAQGRLDTVQFLLTAGADPRAKSADGKSPLQWAAERASQNREFFTIVEMLTNKETEGAKKS